MPYCSRCGDEVTQGVAFCNKCGAPVNATAPITGPQNVQRTSSGGKKFLKWGGIGCGGLICAFIVCGIIIGTSIDESTQETAGRTNAPQSSGGIDSNRAVAQRADQTAGIESSSSTGPTQSPTATILPTSTPVPTPTPTPAPTATPLPIDIGLVEMLREYEQNKVRANARLRYQSNGKIPISTSGYVSEVEELYVSIAPDESLRSRLDCYYADVRTAFHLTKGQSISVLGRVIGEGRYSDSVAMFGCEIQGIQLERHPPMPLQSLRHNTVQVFCKSEAFIFATGYKGTGIILDPEEGTILTVHHVISHENDCDSIEVQLPGAVTTLQATVKIHCASIDRAQLQVSPNLLWGQTFQPVYWASAPAQVDQDIYFWGFGTDKLRMETGVVENTWSD